jgi:hypothetical protein
VTNIVKERRESHNAHLVIALMAASLETKPLRHSTGNMARPKRMIETRVQRTVEGKVGHCELSYAPQPLEAWGVN